MPANWPAPHKPVPHEELAIMTTKLEEVQEALDWLEQHPEGLEHEYRQLEAAREYLFRAPDNPDNIAMADMLLEPVNAGRAAAEAEEFDIAEVGRPACDCAAGEPCCMKGLKVSCSHGTDRLVLPMADENAEARIVLYTDKGAGDGHDMMKISPEIIPIESCTQPEKVPVLVLSGIGSERHNLSGPVDVEVIYPGGAFENAVTDTGRFGIALYKILFGDIRDIGEVYNASITSCYGTSDFDFVAEVYPKMELISTGLEFTINAKLYSNMTFVPSTKFSGGIEVKYGSSSFKIEGDDTDKLDHPLAVSDSVPFIDAVAQRLARMTSGGAAPADSGTHSSIEVYSTIKLGSSKFTLGEHPSDPTKVGIDGEIDFGTAPFFGTKITLDVIDLALTAAQIVAPPLAAAIQRAKNARESLSRGIGGFGADDSLGLRGHVGITLEITGDIGNAGFKLSHPVGATNWMGSGYIGGFIKVKCEAVIEAEGKAYIIEGSVAARGSAESKLNAELKTLTTSEQAARPGKKLNLKVDINGVMLKYSVSYKASFLVVFETSDEASGELRLMEEEVLYETYY